MTPIDAQLDFTIQGEMHSLLEKMDAKIKGGDYKKITSVLVAKDGKLVFEKYYNDNDQNSKHNTRSCTKTMGTLLTGIAIDQGFIRSEKDKAFQYLQHKMPVQNPDPRKEEITIEDLLTMSAILECDDDNFFSRGHEERMYYIEDWAQFYVDLPIRAYPFNPPPAEQPYGRAFRYCSAGSALVAEIVQSAIKQPVADFHKKYLLKPLGIKDYTLHYTPLGTLNTAGGSEYRSRDLLRIIQMCLNGGQWDGQQIISKDWIDKASSPKANAREGTDYGYLFWLTSYGKEKKYAAYYMSGNGGNKVLACPDLNLAVVITAQNYNTRGMHQWTDELMNEYIIPALEGN